MKQKWWPALLLLPVIPWLLVHSCDQPEAATASRPPESKRHGGGAIQPAAPAAAGSEEPTANERTRPTQRPEPRVYPKPKPEEYPTAAAVEGRPGYVTSPYNGKIIDVNGIPAGTLVADPTFPTEEKKYFRAP